MSLSTIRRFLSLDCVDGDAAAVSARNSEVWPTANDVADYAYKSLASIWLLSLPITSAALANTITYKKGEMLGNTVQEINLLSLPEESYQNQESTLNNHPGALDYYMEVIYKLPQKVSDYDRLMNTSLRVRYLLDHRWRRKRGEKPNYIKTVPIVDKSLDQGGIICEWLGFTYPPNGSEMVERWLVRQIVIVPQ